MGSFVRTFHCGYKKNNTEAQYQVVERSSTSPRWRWETGTERPHEHLNAKSATMLFITIECVADVQKQFEWTNKCEREQEQERTAVLSNGRTIYAIWCVNMHDHDDNGDENNKKSQSTIASAAAVAAAAATSNVKDERWLADISIIIVCLNVYHASVWQRSHSNRAHFFHFSSWLSSGIVIPMWLNYLCDALRSFRQPPTEMLGISKFSCYACYHSPHTRARSFDTSNSMDIFKFKC